MPAVGVSRGLAGSGEGWQQELGWFCCCIVSHLRPARLHTNVKSPLRMLFSGELRCSLQLSWLGPERVTAPKSVKR